MPGRTRATDSLQAVLPPAREWPLHDVVSTRTLEAAALAAAPPHTLMARAGQALARLARACAPQARSVLAVAGPGNNGGDAVVAATVLHRLGWRAGIVLLADAARLPSDAAWALTEARAQGVATHASLPPVLDADLLLDGLLGLGATRAPDGALAQAIAAMNTSGRPVIAVDLPSGLHPERGQPLGAQAVVAAHTLSLLTLKPGLFTAGGRDHAGRVWLDDLGTAVPLPQSPWTLAGPPPTHGDAAPHASHKGRFGDVAVLGGAPGMAGAATLAARAALAAGAGRVYLSTLDAQPPSADALWPELMQRDPSTWADPARLASTTVAAGCGGGDHIATRLPPLLAHAARLLLDADALNAIAADRSLTTALQARSGRGRPTILTPHPLEAARLLGVTTDAVQHDRLAAACALAARLGAVVVLKGSGTVTAAPDGRVFVNPTGNALLASAGTGDVLAGYAAGRWARDGASALETAVAAVFEHGAVADRAMALAHSPTLRASDVIEGLRRTAA